MTANQDVIGLLSLIRGIYWKFYEQRQGFYAITQETNRFDFLFHSKYVANDTYHYYFNDLV